jgi:hypothetical protein
MIKCEDKVAESIQPKQTNRLSLLSPFSLSSNANLSSESWKEGRRENEDGGMIRLTTPLLLSPSK